MPTSPEKMKYPGLDNTLDMPTTLTGLLMPMAVSFSIHSFLALHPFLSLTYLSPIAKQHALLSWLSPADRQHDLGGGAMCVSHNLRLEPL